MHSIKIGKHFIASFLIAFLIPCCAASDILFFHVFGTSSHRTSIWPLAEKLANRGHNVTYIFPLEKRLGFHPKIDEIIPSKMLPIIEDYVGDFDINFRLNNSVDQWTMQVFLKTAELCQAFYESPETKKWLSKPGLNYDLILIDGTMGECAYGLVHKFKAKHIMFYPTSLPPFMFDGQGIVPESASVPEPYFYKKPQDLPVSFVDRIKTTLSVFLWRLGLLDFMRRVKPIINAGLKFNPGDEMPSMLDIERNTSLVFVNSYLIEDYPMALPPMIQSYSGLWCSREKLKEVKPLPKELADFVEDPNAEGFIYVSFGSSVRSSAMPIALRDQFISAFEKFPKFKFLWRWPGNNVPSNIPKNLMLRSWFPQHDLLAHSKIKAFIMQAGRPSTQEALCHGVPMISIPIFADQDFNAIRLEHIGAGISLQLQTVSKEILQEAITTMTTTNSYKTKMAELSSLFRDRPLDPLDNVVYWTEYVLRHNTLHLKPLGMNHHWFQRRLLDVYAFLGIFILIIILLTVFALKLCVSRCCNLGRRRNKTKKD